MLRGSWRSMYLQHLYQMFIDAHLPRKCAQPLSSLQKHESIYFNDSCFHRHRRKYWTNSFQMNRTIWLQMSQPDCFSWRMAVREKGDSSFPVSWWNKKSRQRKTESCDITKTFSFQTPHGARGTGTWHSFLAMVSKHQHSALFLEKEWFLTNENAI